MTGHKPAVLLPFDRSAGGAAVGHRPGVTKQGQGERVPDEPLIASLKAAVAARPEDAALRRHLAELLSQGEQPAEALPHVSALLAVDAGDEQRSICLHG